MKRIHTLLLAVVAISCGSVAVIVFKRDQQITQAIKAQQAAQKAAQEAEAERQHQAKLDAIERLKEQIAEQEREDAKRALAAERLALREKLIKLMKDGQENVLIARDEADERKPISVGAKLADIRSGIDEIAKDERFPDVQEWARKSREALSSGVYLRVKNTVEEVVMFLPP